MRLEENSPRAPSSGEAERVRRARKRSTLLAAAALLVGLVWPAFSACQGTGPANGQPQTTPSNVQPQTTPTPSEPFLMPVEDVFSIVGRGTVVTGRVERGRIKYGDTVEIVGILPTRQTVVTGIEMFKKVLDEAGPGDTVGLLLRGVERRDVARGQVIATPGSIKPQTKFKAKVALLKKEEGGRKTPILPGYRPQFYFRTRDVTGLLRLPAGKESLAPGEKDVEVEVELKEPVALEEGLKFAIREGGRTVGMGVVTGVGE